MLGIGRFVKSITEDVLEAVRRERHYHKGTANSAMLFLTYRCSSRCRTCQMWSRPWEQKDELSLDEWIRVADSLIDAGIRQIELYGGDVFLRKNVLTPLVRHLKERGIILHIPMNALSFDEESARALVRSRVDHLYLSVDGIDELHDEIRGVSGAFEKVRNAVAIITEERKGQSLPMTICLTTVSKYNFDFIDRIPGFAVDLGFDEVRFYYAGEMTPEHVAASTVDGFEPTPFFVRDGESILLSSEQAGLLRDKLRALSNSHLLSPIGVNTANIESLPERSLVEGSVPNRRCYVERNLVTVDPGGNVVACPCFHSIKYGNLLNEDFDSVWNSDRHERFHAQINSKQLEVCRHCIYSAYRNRSFLATLKMSYSMRRRGARRKLAQLMRGRGRGVS